MTRKRKRLLILLGCGAGLSAATALALTAFSGSLELFMAPTQLAEDPPPPDRVVRLGGLVEAGSLTRSTAGETPVATFKVTDLRHEVRVTYAGILPDLFREGQGMVALGTLQPNGVFKASEVLAKHDATYMPKDVEQALIKSGRWKPEDGPPPPPDTWNALTASSQPAPASAAAGAPKAGG